jgi:hypothetical protein
MLECENVLSFLCLDEAEDAQAHFPLSTVSGPHQAAWRPYIYWRWVIHLRTVARQQGTSHTHASVVTGVRDRLAKSQGSGDKQQLIN